MSDAKPYPMNEPGTVDLGHGVYLRWYDGGRGFIWRHPMCRAWCSLKFDEMGTGHVLVSGGPDDSNITVQGSLLCPIGCGTHGFITNGRWVSA